MTNTRTKFFFYTGLFKLTKRTDVAPPARWREHTPDGEPAVYCLPLAISMSVTCFSMFVWALFPLYFRTI